jgi:zinc-binding in reverse transcriptase/RNase H
MEGWIGTSTVLYRNGRLKTTLQHHLRSQCQHTVYEGEGVRALLGTKLISNEWGVWPANIYIENQALITATTLMKPSTGHYIFNAFHNSVTALQKKHMGIKIKIKWVPGHKGVEGNEEADE